MPGKDGHGAVNWAGEGCPVPPSHCIKTAHRPGSRSVVLQSTATRSCLSAVRVWSGAVRPLLFRLEGEEAVEQTLWTWTPQRPGVTLSSRNSLTDGCLDQTDTGGLVGRVAIPRGQQNHRKLCDLPLPWNVIHQNLSVVTREVQKFRFVSLEWEYNLIAVSGGPRFPGSSVPSSLGVVRNDWSTSLGALRFGPGHLVS